MKLNEIGTRAKAAAPKLASLRSKEKNEALLDMGQMLDEMRSEILRANALDMESASKNGMNQVMQDRLRLTDARIDGMIQGIREVAALEDPVGSFVSTVRRPNGLIIGRQRVPLGVIGIIYESRPNVTVDAAALCLKAGNAVILRGGSEAINSNIALGRAMRSALSRCGLEDAVQVIEDTSHETAVELMKLTSCLDVLIPRGSAKLINSVVENATVPVIETGVGNCHVYVDSSADLDMAANIVFNAKCSRPSVCNAQESLLVARSVANEFLPLVKSRLDEKKVEIRGCPETCAILGNFAVPAADEDFYTEYLDYILSVKIVSDVDEAIAWINEHGTRHSEAIVTSDYFASQKFLREVDAAAVYVNASTRFTDGGEFGLGAEIGISTQKMHARGPMGVNELTTTKYIVYGEGQIRV
ncbi:MAG: glutamate-5-semialdehyde dehydrogenase [Oscillospiraceae bacterium]|jgi:glutamate-5-semialdehyde dehydrogenase